MSPRWRKIISDLYIYPWRFLIVVSAIMIGTTAVVATLGSAMVLQREMDSSFSGTNPAQAIVWLTADVSPALLEQVRKRPGIVAADARRLIRGRVDVDQAGWHSLLLYGIDDFEALTVSTFHSHKGNVTPQQGEIVVEQSALAVLNTEIGKALWVRTAAGAASLRVSGIVHDPALAPGWMENVGYAYVSRETLAGLGVGTHLDQLRITVGSQIAPETTSQIAHELADWLETQGYQVERVELPPAGQEHPHYDQMGAVMALLNVFSGLALLLSATLTASIITTLMAKQVRQIGVMKSLGATSWQVAGIYIRLVLILALVGVLLALPSGIMIATPFMHYASSELNLEVTRLTISPSTLLFAGLLGLLVPVLVAIVPIVHVARKPAQEALQTSGIRPPSVARVAHRFAGKEINRIYTLALRNVFRRPVRLLMILCALGLGGAVLMTAVNIYQSLTLGMQRAETFRHDDIDIRLLEPADEKELRVAVERVPGVVAAEVWGSILAAIVLPSSQTENKPGTERYTLLAPPLDTTMVAFPIYAGRWLAEGDVAAIVINRALQDRERSLKLEAGSLYTLAAFGNQLEVKIVGVVEEAGPPAMYITLAGLSQLTGPDNTFTALRVVTQAADLQQVAHAVEETLVAAGSFPFFVMTRDAAHEALLDHFMIILIILITAATFVLLVGGLALSTTMSLSILERQREIGIIRALGASRRTVLYTLLIEAGIVVLLSSMVAIVLSIPLSMAGIALVGNHGLHMRLPLVFSVEAVSGWFVLACIVTSMACLAPARSMLRLSVHHALAYE